jgi:hypothetical protein
VKFLIDSMFPPEVGDLFAAAGHDPTNPTRLGANLLDDELIAVAAREGRVIVTENAQDFADVRTCTVLFVLKVWWPHASLAQRLAASVDRWSLANPQPGPWPHWLPSDLR